MPKAKKKAKRRASRKPKRPVGRPSKYRSEFAEIAAQYYVAGATDLEVAEALGIASSTLYKWQHEHPAFSEASKVGKEAADDRVERALFNRAVGYTYDAVKIFQFEGSPVIVPHREHVPPDVGAAFHWLKNRKPDKWRDVKQVETKIELAELIAAAKEGYDPTKAEGS